MSRARARRPTESARRPDSALKARADYGEKESSLYQYASTSRKDRDDACASASASASVEAATTSIVNKLLRLNRARHTRDPGDVSELVRALQPGAAAGAEATGVAAGAAAGAAVARPSTAREGREGREAGEPEVRGRSRPPSSASQAARAASSMRGARHKTTTSESSEAAAPNPATAPRRESSARHPERDAAATRRQSAARPRNAAADARPRTAVAEPDELDDDEEMEAAPEVPRPQTSDVAGGRSSGRSAGGRGAGKRPTYTLYGVRYVEGDAAERAAGCVANAPAARRGGAALPCCCRNCQVALGKRLLRAAQDGRDQDVRRVLESGADVNFTYNSRWTALHRAAAQGFPDALAELLKGGADVEATTRGYSPLHLAAYYDRSGRCAAQLLRAGAQVERANKHGRTALHFAAESNNVAAVRALVEAGACRTAKDRRGWTPIDIARSAAVRRVLHHLD